MKNVAVVYWSGTGNTEQMAQSFCAGITASGGSCSIFTAHEFDVNSLNDYDAIAFGCPSMGVEELEEEEFAPMFEACEGSLSGKKIILFGSYGWGDGEWMRKWEIRCAEIGAILITESVICNESPDEETLEKCKSAGEKLTKV